MSSLNLEFELKPPTSVEMFALGNDEFILIALSNGKILQIQIEVDLANKIIHDPGIY